MKRGPGRPRKIVDTGTVGESGSGQKRRRRKNLDDLRELLNEYGFPLPPKSLKDQPWTKEYAEVLRQSQIKIVKAKDLAARKHGYESWQAFNQERTRLHAELRDLRDEIAREAKMRDYLDRIKGGERLPALPDRSNLRLPTRKKVAIGRLPRYMPEVDKSVPFENRQADDPNAPHFDPRQADQQERALRLAYGGMIRDLRVDTLQKSVYDVAPGAYLDPNQVAEYERGGVKASFSEMYRISRALGLSGEQLLIRWLETLTGRQVTLSEAALPEAAGAADQPKTTKALRTPRTGEPIPRARK